MGNSSWIDGREAFLAEALTANHLHKERSSWLKHDKKRSVSGSCFNSITFVFPCSAA
jgi:hypothetical protein